MIGNEAADVDSLVSAFAIAKFLNSVEVQATAVAQIPREEFRLRNDAVALFHQAGCEVESDGSPAGLLFWNEFPSEAVRAFEQRSVVLTDHNRMSPVVADLFEGRVEWILDHHADVGQHPLARRDIDAIVGSACTLVAEQFQSLGSVIPNDIGVLLSGVILLDTRNFDAKENKGTPRDRAALDALAAFIPRVDGDTLESAAAQWYEQLMEARKDVSHLSVRELLLLDLKVSAFGPAESAVAFSSVFLTMDAALKLAGGPDGFAAHARELAAVKGWQAVVCIFRKDKRKQHRRGLLLIPLNDEAAIQELCVRLVANLKGAPEALQPELKANPLFANQGILEHGFDLQPESDMRPCMAFTMLGAISRKTLLPSAVGPSSL